MLSDRAVRIFYWSRCVVIRLYSYSRLVARRLAGHRIILLPRNPVTTSFLLLLHSCHREHSLPCVCVILLPGVLRYRGISLSLSLSLSLQVQVTGHLGIIITAVSCYRGYSCYWGIRVVESTLPRLQVGIPSPGHSCYRGIPVTIDTDAVAGHRSDLSSNGSPRTVASDHRDPVTCTWGCRHR